MQNNDLELISGSLLEVSVKFNLRNSLSVPDTSVMIEGDKSYVYKINGDNVANKTEVKTGLRSNKNIEVISGLSEGEIIVATIISPSLNPEITSMFLLLLRPVLTSVLFATLSPFIL